jgi:VIT family
MLGISNRPSKSVLEPIERISEILFGLIMVLTLTGTLSVLTADRAAVKTMLLGALGCNLAWGIIDAGMYLMASLNEQGQKIALLRSIHQATDLDAARGIISGAVPPLLASVLTAAEIETIRQRLLQTTEPPSGPRLTKSDMLGAGAVFVLVFLSTFPVVLPFIFIQGNPQLALRISNAIAIGMMFLCGYAFGRYSGLHPWVSGLAMVAVGGALVAIAIALGG